MCNDGPDATRGADDASSPYFFPLLYRILLSPRLQSSSEAFPRKRPMLPGMPAPPRALARPAAHAYALVIGCRRAYRGRLCFTKDGTRRSRDSGAASSVSAMRPQQGARAVAIQALLTAQTRSVALLSLACTCGVLAVLRDRGGAQPQHCGATLDQCLLRTCRVRVCAHAGCLHVMRSACTHCTLESVNTAVELQASFSG